MPLLFYTALQTWSGDWSSRVASGAMLALLLDTYIFGILLVQTELRSVFRNTLLKGLCLPTYLQKDTLLKGLCLPFAIVQP